MISSTYSSLRRFVQRWRRARHQRHEEASLRALPPHILADIGLDRGAPNGLHASRNVLSIRWVLPAP